MARVQPPSPPYLGPAKFHGGAQVLQPLRRVVIHGTVSPCVRGGARATASYFRSTVTRPSSAHYAIDPGEVVQVVGDHQVAYHAPPNTDTIGVELCDPVAGDPDRWHDADHKSMLALAATTVAQLCLAYSVPIRHVGPLRLRAGFRGIAGHVDVSNAWHETTHTDPGAGFPWGSFIRQVRAEAKRLQAEADGPTPPPEVHPIPVAAKPSPKPLGLHIATANIRNNPDLPRPQVRHDVAEVAGVAGVILWQEIAEQDDRDDLAAVLPEPKWQHHNLDTEVPISLLRDKWVVKRAGHRLLHDGKAKVSPARFASFVEVARKGSSLPAFVILNTHLVSGAFSHPNQLAEAWRVDMWGKAHAAITDMVAEFNDRGLTVIGGGDFNRTGAWEGFGPTHRWLVHGGFDHLWVCEARMGGARVLLGDTGSIDLDRLYTDHPTRWARLTLLPPSQ